MIRFLLLFVIAMICPYIGSSAFANNVCNCKGYDGPGGPCYAGPGGDAYDGPGGPAYSGPGGPCLQELAGLVNNAQAYVIKQTWHRRKYR